jgi:PPOX class probable F420-dependent enzyme
MTGERRIEQNDRMRHDLSALSDEVLGFLRERHLATLTTLRADHSPHVVPVGFGYDPGERLVRIITFAGSQKAKNVAGGGRAAVSQVDGGRWLTLEGTARLVSDHAGIEAAVAAYTARYRVPGERPDRVAIEISVDRVMGRA